MKLTVFGLASLILSAPASIALAQSTSDKPISAVPPAGRSDHSASTNTTANTPMGANAGASKEGYAHNTGDVANGPTPAHQTGSQAAPGGSPGATTATIKPGPAYNAGTANVGNSSENNGIQGSQGAGASATMQSGHTTN